MHMIINIIIKNKHVWINNPELLGQPDGSDTCIKWPFSFWVSWYIIGDDTKKNINAE